MFLYVPGIKTQYYVGIILLSLSLFPEESVTFNTLKGLKNRGVKVDLGFPYEMWDTPDAEVTRLKSRVRPW